MNKKIALPILTVALGGGLLFAGTQLASAQTTNGVSGLAQAIAQKFNLNSTDVQNTISGFRTEHRTDMENKRLDNLVSQGKITSAQKQAILDELNKLKSEYPISSFQNLTAAERKQKMQDLQNEINSWAESQGINAAYLRPFGMFGMGMMHRWNKGPMASPTSSPVPSASPI